MWFEEGLCLPLFSGVAAGVDLQELSGALMVVMTTLVVGQEVEKLSLCLLHFQTLSVNLLCVCVCVCVCTYVMSHSQ